MKKSETTQMLEAYAATKAAYEQLQVATREALPIGTLINVTLGRATFNAEVIRHDYGGHVTVVNLDTMKRRRFHAAFTFEQRDLTVLSRGRGKSIYADEAYA